jgi:hypothetical protein
MGNARTRRILFVGLVGWLIGLFVCLFVCLCVFWFVVWLFGWLVGWLVGGWVVRSIGRPSVGWYLGKGVSKKKNLIFLIIIRN